MIVVIVAYYLMFVGVFFCGVFFGQKRERKKMHGGIYIVGESASGRIYGLK